MLFNILAICEQVDNYLEVSTCFNALSFPSPGDPWLGVAHERNLHDGILALVEER